MNKRSVKKSKTAKASRASASRKAPVRKASARKSPARQPIEKLEQQPIAIASAISVAAAVRVTSTVTVAEVVARAPTLRTHKFQVGQTVFYTSSPISRPGASGSYEVVKLLPSDGEDYQ
jgi:hypothetical protein